MIGQVVLLLLFIVWTTLAGCATTIHHHHLQPVNSSKPTCGEYSKWNVLLDESLVHEGNKHYERNYNLRLNNAQACHGLHKHSVSFVIVVQTDLLNFERRELIRNTWALKIVQTLANFRVIFLVGLRNNSEVQAKLEYENSVYADMVQIETDEHYANLTYKSINMLKWYLDYCPQADFLMKTDDDLYLHVPSIVKLLSSEASTRPTGLICHKNKSRRILRNVTESYKYIPKHHNISMDKIAAKFGKYILEADIPGKYYPEYCSGFTYTMTRDIAHKLLLSSQTIPFVSIEDVFLTGFTRQKANVNIVDSEHFTLHPIVTPVESKCVFDKGRITSNEMTQAELQSVWYHVNTNGLYCNEMAKTSVH